MKRMIVGSFIFILTSMSLNAQVKTLTTNELFSKIYNSNNGTFVNKRGIVIDLYASWCAPCHRLAPIFERVAEEYSEYYDFYKVDIEKERYLSTFFGGEYLPRLIFIQGGTNGSSFYREEGFQTYTELLMGKTIQAKQKTSNKQVFTLFCIGK
ncbi:MAG: thioredoxin family protein [Bacteroidetes bacterium]|nr:thioredoxin family protein [Bacteroidota bacterium]